MQIDTMDLEGQWVGENLILDFRSDSTVEFSGSIYSFDTRIRYRIDFEKNPAWLDFIVLDKENREVNRIKALLEVVNKSAIRIAFTEGEPGTRPENFGNAQVEKLLKNKAKR